MPAQPCSILPLEGTVRIDSVEALAARCREALDQLETSRDPESSSDETGARQIALDVTALDYLDGSALQLLVAFATEVRARGAELVVVGSVDDRLRETLEVAGAAWLLATATPAGSDSQTGEDG